MKHLVALVVSLFASAVSAQSLTDPQVTALRAIVCADPTAAGYQTTSDTANVRLWLNTEAIPAFTLWRKVYPPALQRAAILVGSAQLDGLTTGKRDSLLWIAQADIDMTVATIRTAIDDLTGNANALKAAVLDGGKRSATRAEKALAVGNGLFATPAISVIDGPVNDADSQRIVLLPSGQPAGC